VGGVEVFQEVGLPLGHGTAVGDRAGDALLVDHRDGAAQHQVVPLARVCHPAQTTQRL